MINNKQKIKTKLCRCALSIGCMFILMLSMCIQPIAQAYAVSIPDMSDATLSSMDSQKYPDIAQLPVTLYDYGAEVDGTWISKDPSVLNSGIDYAKSWSTSTVDIPATMRFWDVSWGNWLTPGNPSSFLADDGDTLKGGIFRWGMFEKNFSNWSDIIAVPSRDLFGKDQSSCTYNGTCFKKVYNDVMMDFSYNRDSNIYHYSSNESMSDFSDGKNLLKQERGAGDSVGFWPFGEKEVHFGMSMDFDFYLPSQEYLNNNEYYFAFSGDDDLVVYVDDKLTLDLGGAHSPVPGYIDFANEIVVYGTTWSQGQMESFEASVANSGIEMHRDGFDEAGVNWNRETFGYVTFDELGIDLEPQSEHNFKVAYLERGGDGSNLMIEMNMEIQANVDYKIVGDNVPDSSLTDPVPVEEQTYNLYDQYSAKPALQTKDEGYYFMGWYTDEDCTQKWVDGSMLTSAQTTLYGKWIKPEVIKSSDPESGTEVSLGQTISYEVEYTNTDSAEQKVIITDAIPQHTTLVEGSVKCEQDATSLAGKIDLDLVKNGSGVVCATWDKVLPNKSVKLLFDVKVDEDAADKTVENRANIGINDGQVSLTSNIVEHEVTPTVAQVVSSEDPQDPEVKDNGSATKGYVPKTGDFFVAIVGLLLASVGCGIAFLLKALVRHRHIFEK